MIDRRYFLKTSSGALAFSLRTAETKEGSGRSGKHYFYDFHGSPFEVGWQHGQALRNEIRQEAQPSLDAFATRLGAS